MKTMFILLRITHVPPRPAGTGMIPFAIALVICGVCTSGSVISDAYTPAVMIPVPTSYLLRSF